MSLATVLIASTAPLAHRAMFPPEREAWVSDLLELAQKADAAYDLTEPAIAPSTWSEVRVLVKEIVYQIAEEGASDQLISPTNLTFEDFGPGRRSAVGGYYHPATGAIALNERFVLPGDWGSWLSTLIHELVHVQGYFVGDSSVLEAQTEIVATEVLAAMANLNYPGAKRELLDGIRRDALKMAFYIARFDGAPIHSTYEVPPGEGGYLSLTGTIRPEAPLPDGDVEMLARLDTVEAAVFTPDELARVKHRTRWWMDRAGEYKGVLARYVVKTTTVAIDAACSDDETIDESFKRYALKTNRNDRGDTWVYWNQTPTTVAPLRMDDLAWVLRRELGVC